MPHLSPKGPLLLGHCRALALCSGLILALSNRLGLDDRTGVVVYNHLEELAIFHRVNGELQFPFLHLELGGNWLDVTRARRQTTFFFSSRRRHTRCSRDWSSDVCSSD